MSQQEGYQAGAVLAKRLMRLRERERYSKCMLQTWESDQNLLGRLHSFIDRFIPTP